jgi:hypothetical protein
MHSHRTAVALLGLLLPLLLVTGCGESAQAKAEKTVCEGKKEISDSVNSLTSMTLATASADTVKSDLKSIEAGLGKIKGAEDQLSGPHKEAVEKANAQLSAELSAIAHELTSLSLPQALTQVTTSAEKLAASYKHTFASIEC